MSGGVAIAGDPGPRAPIDSINAAKMPSALTLRNQLAAGEISSREVTEHFLRQSEQFTSLGAFTYLSERALEAAALADRRFSRGDIGRLHGMPTAFKDLNEVAGMPTTYGSAAVKHVTAVRDHPMVARLRADGVIFTGKTQVPEFGLSSYSENLIAPPSRNPLNPALSSGGSSGGQAAAVAAGMIPFGPGSDGGGSVRIPAAACGLVGLKPSLGRVPADVQDGYFDSNGAPKFTVSGPIARDATDAALLLDAMTGADRYLPMLQDGPVDALRGLRIGYSTSSPFESVYDISLGSAAREAFDTGLRLLEPRHRLAEARLNYAQDYPETFLTIWTQGLAHLNLVDEKQLGTLATGFRRRAKLRSEATVLTAVARIKQIAADFISQWSAFDVVVTPAMAHTPPEIGYYTSHGAETDYRLQCQYTPYTSMVNVAGCAAITVPVSTSTDGMPMSIQLISPHGDEGKLLILAHQLLTGA
ncbi:amidase [Glutamicibacter sp. MNS18]|uniref:amidase n=1 Tax=Glutamicibacter sp. MNS18 TaxID=2989817 RepID=UPI002235FADF|nr:amidase [Glutamicibacter sp. MNS18]MCW4466702.1 amidase [Glutamicibacter sp. MNS18]